MSVPGSIGSQRGVPTAVLRVTRGHPTASAIVGPLRSPQRYYSLLSHPTHTSTRVLRACRVPPRPGQVTCRPPWPRRCRPQPPSHCRSLVILGPLEDIHIIHGATGGFAAITPHPAPHLGKTMGVHHSPLVAGGPFGGYLAAAAAQQPDLFAARSRSTLPAPPSPRA